ncbi:type II toxin-antitoxin system HicB family antitoxin [Aromatoleum evansii]|uniref:type II toxin-antitoxin system HicB family antitoxin n=1 Tax=Aromatoleum evansii TaxID=59406 RepID=UPI00145CD348|nr:hypothetical protein [Aromatoleum evansii]NMG27960.1 hypothetical protein [Aromatoleum evansii]
MERKLSYVVFWEEGAFVARCLDIDVASDGPTEQEAVVSLKEALELYFDGHKDALMELPCRSYRFGQVAIHAKG